MFLLIITKELSSLNQIVLRYVHENETLIEDSVSIDLNSEFLKSYRLLNCSKIEYDESSNIPSNSIVLLHRCINNIELDSSKCSLSIIYNTIQNFINLNKGSFTFVNRIGIYNLKFIQTTADNTGENIEYYIFIKESFNGVIIETLHFKNTNDFDDWFADKDITWLDVN